MGGCGGEEAAAAKRAVRARHEPDSIPNQGHGLSRAPLEKWRSGKSHYTKPLHSSPGVAKCIASCRTGAPWRIELRLLDFQNRRGELRVYVLFVLTCSLFRRASPMKDIVRRKALQSAPRSGRIFAAEGEQVDL